MRLSLRLLSPSRPVVSSPLTSIRTHSTRQLLLQRLPRLRNLLQMTPLRRKKPLRRTSRTMEKLRKNDRESRGPTQSSRRPRRSASRSHRTRRPPRMFSLPRLPDGRPSDPRLSRPGHRHPRRHPVQPRSSTQDAARSSPRKADSGLLGATTGTTRNGTSSVRPSASPRRSTLDRGVMSVPSPGRRSTNLAPPAKPPTDGLNNKDGEVPLPVSKKDFCESTPAKLQGCTCDWRQGATPAGHPHAYHS